MNIKIRVFESHILLNVNNGMSHIIYDWIMAFDFIRENDTVSVENHTGKII